MKNIKNKKWFKIGKFIFVLIALGFLGYMIKKNYSELMKYHLHIDIKYVLIGIAIWSVSLICGMLIWYKIMHDMDFRMNPFKFLFIGSITTLAKYIPVNFVSITSRATLLMEEGAITKQIFKSMLFESFFNVITAFLFCGLIIYPDIGLPIGIACLLSIILLDIFIVRIKVDMTIVFTANFILQFIEGCAIFFFIKSVIPVENILQIGAYFQGAWAIGFCSLFAPSGIGVRESAFVILLSNLMPQAQAIIAAIAARLGTIMANVVICCLIILSYTIKRRLNDCNNRRFK